MKKFVSLLTSMIVTLFVIGCSNPSSSSGGSLGTGGAEDNSFTLEQLTSGVNLTISNAYTKLISSSQLRALAMAVNSLSTKLLRDILFDKFCLEQFN